MLCLFRQILKRHIQREFVFFCECFEACMCITLLITTRLPAGTAIAPSFRVRLSSGIIRSISNSVLNPSPVQQGHAPNGLLNEKLRGSISSMLMPQSGQEKLSENNIVSPPITSTFTKPSASFRQSQWNPSDGFQCLL